MKKALWHAGAFLGLVAMLNCASPTGANYSVVGYEQVLNSWLGVTEGELLRSWGHPTSRYEMSGGHYLLLFSKQGETVVSPSYARSVYNPLLDSIDTFNSGAVLLTFMCDTEFELNHQGVVVRWRHEGNDCRAREKPWVGLRVKPMSADDLERLGLRQKTGLMVTHVVEGGPAWNAGLRDLDVILSVGGTIASVERIRWFVTTHSPGDHAFLKVWSYASGKSRLTKLVLGFAP